MMKKQLLFCYILLLTIAPALAQIKSPQEFLGYRLGEKFTRYNDVEAYFKHLSSEQARTKLDYYGSSYEGRPLFFMVMSSAENMANLETIRQDNLRRAGLLTGATSTNIPIVWMSYNVHGNEAVGTEAALITAYELLAKKQEWLSKVVVIIDPCLNPDGRERYVNYYYQYGAMPYNPDPQAMELNEPWPGGRPNHYLFDLNRDWAWQTQQESQQRITKYNAWLPQIHVDFHEQGVNSPYYFAPAAEPFHELVSDWQRKFQDEIGRNNAKYLDQINRFYFTKQRFDLLYPSYGDTYPTYNGAIGMTYEQGGSGRAGLGVINQEGDTLTLKERIENHFITGISTVEVAVNNATKLTDEFQKFFKTSPKGPYKSFVVKADGQNDKVNQLTSWLDVQGIRYTIAGSAVRGLSGFRYSTGKTDAFAVAEGDVVVTTSQPKAVLAQVLFEPKTTLADSLTYDITAWSIPYSYGLEGYATSAPITVQSATKKEVKVSNTSSGNVYAYLMPWRHMNDAKMLAALLKAEVKVRFTTEPMVTQGKTFERGTVIISKRDNLHMGDGFEKAISSLGNSFGRELVGISSGLVDKGPDIGSSDINYLRKPRIALIGGEGTASTDFGSTWHFMEQELQYPATVLSASAFGRVDLSSYNVLIVPNLWFNSLGDGGISKIKDWVRKGGKLVLTGRAVAQFEDSNFGGLRKYNNDQEERRFKERNGDITKSRQLMPYADREREFLKENVPGAIFRVTLDNTHPLAYGYGNTYFSLKTDNSRYAYLERGGNVGTIRSKGDHMAGFAGQYVRDAAAESMVFGAERVGAGQVVYLIDNPLFRSFWHNGKLMFCNALFFVGQ